MNSVNKHIEYLILRHDCVVIPGIGALIACHAPAYIDKELGCIFPPKRNITFNPNINHNDGLLATSMARRGCLTYDNAVTLMNEEIDLMRHQIEAHGEYAVGRLGALHRNTEGTLIFEPFASTLISPRLCGLKPVKATPIAIEKPESLTTENVIASAENSRLSFKGVFKIAASIILLVGLGITISTPVIENAPDFAGIATTRTVPKTEPLFVNDINPDIQLTIALPDPETASATVEKKEDKPQKEAILRRSSSDIYFLIIASLPTREKAAEFIAMNKNGNDMDILESGGRYRIYISSGNTYAEAQAPIAGTEYAATYPDAWVCRRD